MLQLLREIGFPPMLIGAFKHGMKGISEAQVREMCARVSIGMANIYAGGDVRESLSNEVLLDDEAMIRMISALKNREIPLAIEA